jgi:MFS superfamily sulfate permease-like transporter
VPSAPPTWAAGLFQGFAISSSASRTPVAVAAGARSQLTPLVGAVTIALLLVLAPGALRDLPCRCWPRS